MLWLSDKTYVSCVMRDYSYELSRQMTVAVRFVQGDLQRNQQRDRTRCRCCERRRVIVCPAPISTDKVSILRRDSRFAFVVNCRRRKPENLSGWSLLRFDWLRSDGVTL